MTASISQGQGLGVWAGLTVESICFGFVIYFDWAVSVLKIKVFRP